MSKKIETGTDTKYGHAHTICGRCAAASLALIRSSDPEGCCVCGREIPPGQPRLWTGNDLPGGVCKKATYGSIYADDPK